MLALAQAFPVLSFLGVVVQLGGALMLIGLFVMLRRFVVRRAYFGAWGSAWVAFAAAIAALVVRYMIVAPDSPLGIGHPGVRGLYFVYQMSKALGFAYFLRGTLMYIAGTTSSAVATKRFWAAAAGFAIASTLLARNGTSEVTNVLVIWQSAIAVPTLGYCAVALLRLPRPRRTLGSSATGVCFGLLAGLWFIYANAFSMVVGGAHGRVGDVAQALVGLNAYVELAFNILLAYSMVLLLMEDNKREIDDAQAELDLTHDQLRRAALYDSLTDSLNRRAFAEGVGLDMVRSAFGTVVIADLDNLKHVNDRLGHTAGDDLIRRCADVLRATLRPYDKLYRWGGDEFLLILPSARAADVVQQLRDAIDRAASTDASSDSGEPGLRVSLGAAGYSSFEALDEAIERADRAMYREKGRRKTRPVGFAPARGSGTPPTPAGAVR